jgi:hypothetical protein
MDGIEGGVGVNIVPFQFDGAAVRTITTDAGEVLFVGKDVAAALGYRDHTAALKAHVPDDCVSFSQFATRMGQQSIKCINKRGLLILLARSRMAGSAFLDRIVAQVMDLESILRALADFEVPDDLPDLYVYAIRETETGRVKLGISRDPEARLAQLQVGNSQRLELVATRHATNRFADERKLHREYSQARVRSEWFAAEAAGAIQ